MFFLGGSVQNYLKNTDMLRKFERKLDDGDFKEYQEKLTEQQREIQQLEKQAADVRKSNAVSAIDSKLKSGGVLTQAELAYLKENNPTLYQKAVEVIEERKAYRKTLQRAVTKDDVARANSLKLQQFTAELKSARGDIERTEQIGRRFAGVMDEHNDFVGSERYKQMPTDEELHTGRKKPSTKTYEGEELPKTSPESFRAELKVEIQSYGINTKV